MGLLPEGRRIYNCFVAPSDSNKMVERPFFVREKRPFLFTW